MRTLHFTLTVCLTAAPLAAAHAATTDQADTLTVVKTFLAGFNTGDDRSMLTTCAAKMTIIDDIPPHIWRGPSACRDWKKAVDAFLRDTGETNVTVALGEPSHNDVTGDRAYIVAPLTFKYTQGGKPIVDTGSQMIVSLRKFSIGWQMTGWACAEHR